MHWIGIDVSKKRLHVTWLREPTTGKVRSKALSNDAAGHAQLLAWAERQTGAVPAELAFVLEATGVYHEGAALALHEAGARVSVVNPLHVKRFAESLGLRPKNDRHDGLLLARFGHERQPEPWQPPAPEVRELQALLRRLAALERDRQREANRLEKAEVESAPQRVLESLHTMGKSLEEEIARLRKQLDDHIDGHPELKEQRELLQSIPGVGQGLSSWFLALFLSRRFRSAKQAAAFLGLVPTEYQSGTSVLKRPRLAKSGDGRWRARLYMPAMVAIRYNPLIRAQYARLTGAGKSKMSAVGAAMRKLVHIAFGVFHNRTPFQEQNA